MPKSVVTENGLQMELEGSATVKLGDNSKEFEDMPDGHGAKDAVDYMSARELC